MTAQQDISQVRKIIQDQLANYQVRIFLFGSHATGKACSTSDIDVAVFPGEELPAGLLSSKPRRFTAEAQRTQRNPGIFFLWLSKALSFSSAPFAS